MKKYSKPIVALIILVILIISIGIYYGHKNYVLKNENKASNKTPVDKNKAANDAKKNATNEKIKKIAMDKVSKAETTKTQVDIDEARKSVDIMPAGKDKDDLNKKLDKITAGDKNAGSSAVAWVKAPTYNGITTLITGTVDVNKVKTVKASVENAEIAVVLNKDGTFSIDCNNLAAGKVVKIKAYDKNDKEVSSSDIVRAL